MELLFKKGYIGKCQIKNRVVMTAMTTGFAGLDGLPTEQLTRYYEERAKGGVGLIVTEIFCLNKEHGVAFPRQMYALNPMHVQPLAQMVARVHKYGTKIFAQLHHGGSTNSPELNGGKIYGPSAIPNVSGIVPEAFTLEQIEELKQQFIMTAAACQAADFDGVELHGAHGYLLCEFLSASSNQRDDKYGGSLENRCRLPIEILQGIKAVCGPDFPVAIRYSADEYDPDHEGSITLEDGVAIAKEFEKAGFDALDVSCGNYFCKYGENEEPYSYEQGWRRHLSKAVKDAVNLPVIAINTIKQPEVAEELLEEGCCDFVGVGRGHIADPEWVRKAAEGRSCEIHKCLGCLYCFESLMTVGYMRCSVNPRVGREATLSAPCEKNGNGRKVGIVGGGPAGLQSASVLASRGFDVTLYEKEDKVGGAANLAAATAPYKVKIAWLVDALRIEAEKAGAKIKTNCCATPELLKADGIESVFYAAGALQAKPNLPGLDGSNVKLATDVISGKEDARGNIAVIGSGLSGLEVAEMLLHDGRATKVTLVDMLPQLGTGMYPPIFVDIMKQLAGFDVTFLPGHALLSADEKGVDLCKLEDNTPVRVDADSILIATGQRIDSEALKAFENEFDRVVVVGESKMVPGRIATSVSDAYIAALGFDPIA